MHKLFLCAAILLFCTLTQAFEVQLPDNGQGDPDIPITWLSAPTGLPSIGEQKIFVLLMEFNNYEHLARDNVEKMTRDIFGEGKSDNYPFDSVSNFYRRSSFGKLDIVGDVLGWYKVDADREDIDQAEEVKRALQHYDQLGHDFSQYDRDGNGIIDSFVVIWTGPDGTGSLDWNPHYGSLGDREFELDGKTFASYVSTSESFTYPYGEFEPATLIHELGHALGLPDLYDTNRAVGLPGGLGGLDIMGAGDHGDHNALSKFLLGWITPQVLGSGSKEISLAPASSSGDALLIMSDADENTVFSEYFLVENRDNQGNDASLSGNSGLFIWHIEASLSEEFNYYYMKYNNRDTERKRVRLVQADGLGEIEREKPFDSGDIFQVGDEFSPDSKAQSRLYSGQHSGVKISNIRKQGDNFVFSGEIIPVDSVPDFNLATIEAQPLVRENSRLQVEVADDVVKVDFYLGDQLLASDTSAPFAFSWQTSFAALGSHELKVQAFNAQGYSSSEFTRILHLPEQPVALVVSLSSDIADAPDDLLQQLTQNDIQVLGSDFIPPLSPDNFNLVMVNFGSFHESDLDGDGEIRAISRPASGQEQQRLADFTSAGGKLLVEGEAVFSYTGNGLLLDTLAISLADDPHETLYAKSFSGKVDTELDGISAEFAKMDFLDNLQASPSIGQTLPLLGIKGTYLAAEEVEGDCVIGFDNGVYKSIAASCLLAKLPENERRAVLNAYLAFFDFPQRIAARASVQLSAAAVTIAEDAGVLTLEVVRSGSLSGQLSVQYATVDDTAIAGVDYQENNGELVFADGEAAKQIEIKILDNANLDHDRRFQLRLSGDNIGEQHSVDISIKNDDISGQNSPNKPAEGNSEKSPGGAVDIRLLLLLLCLVFLQQGRAMGRIKLKN
ncbi:M6 family metalloprotease domain-containing protein [Thalassomonas haliotis]|uniref:M6 family metalloprotease domain-containing protein n=1 Tax=Thalassomonas haliotis TaxID=485448 RepID=A0ABY7VCM1_9GAMM|nr:M6 family metalloprotease domain-containing protein [Thalassomonas haliotis]WDE11130.1 M6 family metalloprotease domain-containing protein [Thalassomonas haliotis]